MKKTLRYIPLDQAYRFDCFKMMKLLPEDSIDAIVCDPPYEIGFMGKNWDSTGIAFNVEMWKEAYRVLKPGGHLVAFSGTRTIHRMAVAIEDAGFEIRDQLQWVYNSGFPKNHDLSKAIDKKAGAKRKVIRTEKRFNEPSGIVKAGRKKEERKEIVREITAPATKDAIRFNGYGTALKPSHEPIVLARKPISEKTIAENVLRWGTGGLNIEAGRIGEREKPQVQGSDNGKSGVNIVPGRRGGKVYEGWRFPANTIILGDDNSIVESKYFNILPKEVQKKASSKDRDSKWNGEEMEGKETSKNNHATVKPLDLMEHIIKLVTPPNDKENPVIVFDPFAGSGSTLVAAKRLKNKNNAYEHLYFLGAELEKEHVKIIRERLKD